MYSLSEEEGVTEIVETDPNGNVTMRLSWSTASRMGRVIGRILVVLQKEIEEQHRSENEMLEGTVTKELEVI